METTKTYVEYSYPGSFFSEYETKEVETRNPESIAKKAPEGVFAFRFFDKTSKLVKVDGQEQTIFGKEKNVSPTYYPDGVKYTLEDVRKLGKSYSILLSNMEGNNWSAVVKTRCGNFEPFGKNAVIV